MSFVDVQAFIRILNERAGPNDKHPDDRERRRRGEFHPCGTVRPLPCDEAALRTYSSDDVRARICSGDPAWKDLVAPEVAAHIEAHGIAGFTCDL